MQTIQTDFNEYLKRNYIEIDLGCGNSKKKNTIGIDIIPLPNVDIVCDIEKGLSFIPDNSVDKCTSTHFLEHIHNFEFLIEELYRIVKSGGIIEITVPHFSNPLFYSDYTHKRFFGLYTFDYFSQGRNNSKRVVPTYNDKVNFEIQSKFLNFKSSFFSVIKFIKKNIHTKLFNSSPFIQEIYENYFSKRIACSEIIFKIKVIK